MKPLYTHALHRSVLQNDSSEIPCKEIQEASSAEPHNKQFSVQCIVEHTIGDLSNGYTAPDVLDNCIEVGR